MSKTLTYADAGVDIDKANKLVDSIKQIARRTPQNGVLGEIGGFGGLYVPNLSNYEQPVLVSSTDGVGTKLKIAFLMDRHDTIGIDLVAMCVNDIVVQGAKPLFFLDYLSTGKLDAAVIEQVIAGIGQGCQQAGCALIGGETAEMPGFYPTGEYDMAGFVVGLVDNHKIVDGSDIRMGHKLIGLASSGLHANGYSLVRKICFDRLGLSIDSYVPELGKTLGEELLTPTRIYVEIVHQLIKLTQVHGLSHITGGGLVDNIVRVLPEACAVRLQKHSWDVPPVFNYLQAAGQVDEFEMQRTFNNGVGMVAVVPEQSADDAMDRLRAMGETAWLIGEIVKREQSAQRVSWSENVC